MTVSKDPACTLPGSPMQGRPGPGFMRHETTFKALKRPLYPYTMAIGDMCGRLGEGQHRSRARHLGRHDYVAPGERFRAGVEAEQDFVLGTPPRKIDLNCSPGRKLAEDEGELVFFVGEEKYRVTFEYETLPSRVEPIP